MVLSIWRTCRPLKLILLGLLTFTRAPTLAQGALSRQDQLSALMVQLKNHSLNDTGYLNAVDSIANSSYDNDSLKQWLSDYRQIAFSDTSYGKYRVHYYRHLMRLSNNKSWWGSMIYYSEKNNEESVRMGYYEKDELPHAELVAISTFLGNRDYDRVFSRYNKLRPRLLAMPGQISAGAKPASPNGVSMIFGVLEIMSAAAGKTGDTARLNEAIALCEKMQDQVRKQPAKYGEYRVYYQFISDVIGFYKENYLKHTDSAGALLEASIREVRSKDFGEANFPFGYTEDQYENAFDFYLMAGLSDSAFHYLDLINDMVFRNGEFSNDILSFFLDGRSKLLAGRGNYEAAYKDLRKLALLSDSALYAVKADRENNLYALSQAEDNRNDLIRTGERKQELEQFNIVLVSMLILLALFGVVNFLSYYSKQKQRLLRLQVDLARNFHDDIGPMVLYAGILIKKEAEFNPSVGLEDIKSQLSGIMDAVRGIAHDLKSGKPGTVHSFYKEIGIMLEKVRRSTGIDFRINMNKGNRILSHLQYTHLRKIAADLIADSILQATCTLITIEMMATDKNLRIIYTDNGTGVAPGAPATTGGIQSIQQRTGLLKGEAMLHIAWPKGYSIDISIPLI